MLLEIKKIFKKYDSGLIALKDISFDVNKGEFVSIIGLSGSGKSTLIKSINRMINITDGEIYFEGVATSKLKNKDVRILRRRIGMIFQNYNLVEKLTVIENVLHGRLGYKSTIAGSLGLYTEEEKKQAFILLEKVGMLNFAYTRCSELSGGQKQRVGIARALIQNPNLLLCDEPISSLDPKTATIVMDYLKKIVEEMNIACIINLHQVEIAKKYSTRIIALKYGEKVFDGKPVELTEEVEKMIYEK